MHLHPERFARLSRGDSARAKAARLLIVLAGILFGQVVLYGPSLLGRKILLPLDILTKPGIFIPQTPGQGLPAVHNEYVGDMIYVDEPARRFAGAELRAGRLPMWMPNYYAGAPFIRPKFSPFVLLECCVKSPVILAWAQLLAAMVAGLGAYVFFRRVLRVGFWPAAIAAWCYPLTAFFVLWQGFATALPVCWLPWILLAVDKTARGTGGFGPVALSGLTCLVVVSGQLDIAAQVLTASGLFALWALTESLKSGVLSLESNPSLPSSIFHPLFTLAAGWGLGILLAAPYILPVLDYTRTGARMSHRRAGEEERPPVGVSALPQTVLPNLYGGGNFRLTGDNELESSAAAYAGLFATLLLAPLAWCSRRHLSINVFWACLALLGLGWCLNVPGLVQLLRLPGLNMVSHNRFVFVTAFAVLSMTAVGLDVLSAGPVAWRRWFWVPPVLLAGLGAWCAYRVVRPPELIDTQLGLAILQGMTVPGIRDLDDVRQVQSWFTLHYAAAALLCGLGAAGWWVVRSGNARRFRLLPVLAVALVGDLLWFGYGRNGQCDPALYFPGIPALEEAAKSVPGRVVGFNCLPANLATMCGLSDVRGYDGVDPKRYVELVIRGGGPETVVYPYAQLHMLTPRFTRVPGAGLRLWPIFDLLNVRYVIFRGAPPPDTRAAFQSPDYWVLVNSNALDRAFVPRRVETVTNDAARIAELGSAAFNPREVACVEEPVALPADCRGTARMVSEIPTRVTVALQMETPGLVVLSDLWDAGWQAYLNGKRAPILRADHALRGVVVPAGDGTLEFRYRPASFALGLKLAAGAALALGGWLAIIIYKGRASVLARP